MNFMRKSKLKKYLQLIACRKVITCPTSRQSRQAGIVNVIKKLEKIVNVRTSELLDFECNLDLKSKKKLPSATLIDINH